MPLVYSVASAIGPAIGGALANPYHRKPSDPTSGPLFWRFPYALPNLVVAGFLFCATCTGLLFFEETLATKKNRPDPGLMLGRKLVTFSSQYSFQMKLGFLRLFGVELGREHDGVGSYIPIPTDEEISATQSQAAPTEKEDPTCYTQIFGTQTVLCLVKYWMLAMHSTAYDQIIAVFLHHPRRGTDVSDEIKPPFGFNKGLGMGLYFSSQYFRFQY